MVKTRRDVNSAKAPSLKEKRLLQQQDTSMKRKAIKWMGLAKVLPLNSDILGDASGAYVNVVAFAKNKRGFRKTVKGELAAMGLTLKRLENPRPLKDHTIKYGVSKEIVALSKRLQAKTNSVEFSAFHTFP
jgi:hypothetical protein